MDELLKPKQVEGLLHLYVNKKWGVSELATLFGVSPETVSKILTGRTWKEVTGGKNVSRYGEDTAYYCTHIVARLEQGCRNNQIIANELGITRQAVSKLIKTKGLLEAGNAGNTVDDRHGSGLGSER